MPTYDYRCDHCGHAFSTQQRYGDAPVEKCPQCGERPRKLVSWPAIVFKGSGWHVTDYRKRTPGSDGPSSGDGASGAKPSPATPTDTKPTDTKPTDAAPKQDAARDGGAKGSDSKGSTSAKSETS